MLGYGNLGALANDPRVNPRAWQDDNDVGATHQRLQPNCGVSRIDRTAPCRTATILIILGQHRCVEDHVLRQA